MTSISNQWIRKIRLRVISDKAVIDLSEFKIKFSIQQGDADVPDNLVVRIYNLSQTTINKIENVNKGNLNNLGEFNKVTLEAGYENTGNFGTIFSGTIKQMRIGRENNINSYIDILGSDGDVGYNQSFINENIKAGETIKDAIQRISNEMNAKNGTPASNIAKMFATWTKAYTPVIRGQVLFGMSRAKMRMYSKSIECSWTIKDGQVVVTPLTQYAYNEVVKINASTGMIGIPEQTDGGIRVRCLLNSKIKCSQLVELNSNDINQTINALSNPSQLLYNSRSARQPLAPVSKAGTYRVFVVEHVGDTRGDEWYTDIICLAIDLTTGQVPGV
jgi:hypothetical protein